MVFLVSAICIYTHSMAKSAHLTRGETVLSRIFRVSRRDVGGYSLTLGVSTGGVEGGR